ncbi:hypothetical protein GCM10009613_18600 [Pseudonocardia kongjuensis]|uniref:Uncharacterized protein n=1 Tax=Pseudonocardia kongjuensis TaxID=102227 RepID=A0ABP4IE02_9PSEU
MPVGTVQVGTVRLGTVWVGTVRVRRDGAGAPAGAVRGAGSVAGPDWSDVAGTATGASGIRVSTGLHTERGSM